MTLFLSTIYLLSIYIYAIAIIGGIPTRAEHDLMSHCNSRPWLGVLCAFRSGCGGTAGEPRMTEPGNLPRLLMIVAPKNAQSTSAGCVGPRVEQAWAGKILQESEHDELVLK
jgi:hypothetical protein